MARIGNKQNSFINGEWAKHFRDRQLTSKLRRAFFILILLKQIKEEYNDKQLQNN